MRRLTTTWIGIGITAVLVAAGVWFLYGWGTGYGYGGGSRLMPHGMMPGGGMGLVMILFWVIVLIALASIVSGLLADRGNPRDDPPDALELLKRRYARGEIDKETYASMRRDLEM